MQYPKNLKTFVLAAAFLSPMPAIAAGMTTSCYEEVHQPAVFKNITRTILTQRASTTWEYRDINGRNILCKVHHPAVYQKVRQNVMVRPARTVLKPVRIRDCKQSVRLTSNF